MAKPPVKPDGTVARHREDALKVLLETSSPAAVAEVAADLRLSSAMVYRQLAVYRRAPSTSSLLPNRGGRGLRRSLLAAIGSLILPASMCRTLIPDAGRGLPFWTKLRACHSPATGVNSVRELQDGAGWPPQLWISTGKGIFLQEKE